MNFLMLFSLGSLIKKFKLYTNGYAAVTETLVNLFFQCRNQEFYNSHATIKFEYSFTVNVNVCNV